MSRTRVGVLISGRGSNMQALVRAAQDPAYPAEIALVLSNQPDAGGLDFAREQGIPAVAIDHRPFGKDREAHERLIDQALREAQVEVAACAGYMRILTPWLTNTWAGRMINIHPSLLPLFPGLHTHRRALEAGMKLHGCTVHEVTAEVDDGPIIGQAAVPVLAGDDEVSLAARVLKAEHRLYPASLAAFVQGEAPVAPDTASLFNPAA
jgi:phosphoribosylglycinamide formyltransferase 1